MTVTARMGDGRGDGNSRTVSRNLLALFLGIEFTRADTKQRRTGQRGASVRISAGDISNFAEHAEQGVPNAVGMSFLLFVDCSFCLCCSPNHSAQRIFAISICCSLLFGVVRCVFVLKNSLKVRRCAEICTCSFCSAKNKDTL